MKEAPQLWSREAEESVLGSILIEPDALHEISDTLRPPHFHAAINRAIYKAMLAADRDGVSLDSLTLAEALERGKVREPEHGWLYHLTGLFNVVPHAANINSHARIVADYGKRRGVIATAEKAASRAYDLDTPGEQALTEGIEQFIALQQDHDTGAVLSPKAYTRRFLDDLENDEDDETIPTPIVGLNQMLVGGWTRPHTHIVAGRPKMGKSSLGLQCGLYASMNLGLRVYAAITEMSDRQFTRRAIAQRTGLDATKLKLRNLSPEQMMTAMNEAGRLSEQGPYLDVSAGLTPGQVRARAMRLAGRGGLDLIIVDHLHEMAADHPRAQRHLELGEMARSLRETAKALDVPLVLLAQLSRSVENRRDKRPQLSDLREAGALEEVAFSVTFVYRPHYYDELKDEAEAELIVAAHRDGPTGIVPVKWNAAAMRFENLEG